MLPALLLVVATGVLMTSADLDTFLHSKLFWAKMGLFAVMLVNGAGLMAAERAAVASTTSAPAVLTGVSVVSLISWLGLLLLGVWLTVGA